MTIRHEGWPVNRTESIPGYARSFWGFPLPIVRGREIWFQVKPENQIRHPHVPQDEVIFELKGRKISRKGPLINLDPTLRRNGFTWEPSNRYQRKYVEGNPKRFKLK